MQFTAAMTPAKPVRRSLTQRLGRIGVMAVVPLLLIAGAVVYYLDNKPFITTDNAYVHQDKTSVSAQVTGNIIDVAVHENQIVKPGDLLFRIDPEPFKIAIAQADATIAAGQVRVIGMESELNATGADIRGAAAGIGFYEAEYRRQSELMARGFTTRARLQAAEHDLNDARTKLANAQSMAIRARAALSSGAAAPGVNPAVLAGLAQKRKAELELSRSVVRAPVGGKISQSSRLEIGQMMTQGLPALSIVANDTSWIEANFKETELADMQIGQLAVLTFDAYPGMKVKGHVASIGAGTGSEFSILPAQNANGNWVKVTQRVPVRIAIDSTPTRPLIAGLSTHVSIDTRK